MRSGQRRTRPFIAPWHASLEKKEASWLGGPNWPPAWAFRLAAEGPRALRLVIMAERVLHPVGQLSVENKRPTLLFAMRGLLCASAVQSHKQKESRSCE